MRRLSRSVIAAGTLGVIASSGCGSAMQQTGSAPGAPRSESRAAPTTNPAKRVNAADLRFMSGMIPHHAQAVLIAGWAPTHGARADVRVLCERIVVAQRDEIALMQTWLRDRGQVVPAANATHMTMMMDGMEHKMLMPGMLTDPELAQLDKSRGSEFDRLFLRAMIGHHQGAVTMVDTLFAARGAGQDEVVFRFASDVYADQTTEIDRMQKMLATIPAGSPGR